MRFVSFGAEFAPYFWLQPAIAGAGAALVLAGAGVTVRQRYVADRRDQWWKRTQWALDLVVRGEEDATVLGMQVLAQQILAKTAHVEDARFITQVVRPTVDSYRSATDTETQATRGD